MSIETLLLAAITPLCSRCYPDFAAPATATPFVTYQQVGGSVLNELQDTPPSHRNARIQVNVWADTRQVANELMRSIETALRASPLHGRPVGALIARFDDLVPLRGAQQDFTFWHT